MKKHIVLVHGTWCHGNIWGEFVPALEQLGFIVHTPSLRYHDLPYEQVAEKVGAVSITDYVNDTVAYIQAIGEPVILLGHSLGCLIAQLAAQYVQLDGMILMGPAPTADIFAFYPSMVRCFIKHFLQWGFWKKPMPPYKKEFFNYCMNEQTLEAKEAVFKQLVPESGLVYTQMAFPFFDRNKACVVDYSKIHCPVLTITGSNDKMTVSAIAQKTAKHYNDSILVSITGADHMYEAGKYMPQTISIIDAWTTQKQLRSHDND